MNIHDLLEYYRSESMSANRAKELSYEVSKIWFAETGIGYIALKEKNCLEVYTVFPELERRYSLNSEITNQLFIDVFIERSRELFKYLIFLSLKKYNLTILFHPDFNHYLIHLLYFHCSSKKSEDKSQILNNPTISLEEYKEKFFKKIDENYHDKIDDKDNLDKFNGGITLKNILDFASLLYPSHLHKEVQEYVNNSYDSVWLYVFFLIMYDKFGLNFYKIYTTSNIELIQELSNCVTSENTLSQKLKSELQKYSSKEENIEDEIKMCRGKYKLWK